MNKKEFISEVHSAIADEIKAYLEAGKSINGLLNYLQKRSWFFPEDLVNKYYGKNHKYFDVFDTQEHLDEFIKATL